MIGKRLKELRYEKNLLQKDVANYLNISTSAYGYYEQGKRNPDTETIKNLANFFNVSTDYLLGRTDSKKDYTKSNDNLHNHNFKSKGYKEIEEKIEERLLNEGIIKENEPITQDILDKVLKYGIEATIEILKLEKKLENDVTPIS
ncbi:helix-turn-helix transcriptional regulator [Tissierella sp.]|uniref:helix-turn-helix domain-containing protein n=1 Tax=Tissierella sp. TaxID=41274 RepID=UPI003033607A